MRISDILRTDRRAVSFEFFPPNDDAGFASLFETIEALKALDPSYVSVTYGAGGSTRRKTVELVKRIKHEIGIESMAHLTCVGANRDEIGGVLDDLAAAGLENVLPLRGDPPKGESDFVPTPGGFRYANELVAFIRRDIYAGVDTNVNAGLLDKVLFAWHFVGQAVLQFSPLGAVIAGWGMMATWQAGWRLGLLCEAGAFAAGSFGLIAVLGFDYTPFWVAVARPYYLVPYGILALWLGYGVHAGVQVLRAWIDGEVGGTSTHRGVHTVGQVLRIRADRLLPALYVAAGLGIVALGIVNADENYRPHDRFAAEQAQMILDLVEENGVLVIHGDGYTAPLAYLHFVEGLRHDVRILTSNGWVFHDRIIDPAWPMERAGSAMLEFFNESSRPVYVPAHDELSGFGLRNLGFLKMLDPSVTPGRTVFDSNLRAKEFFKQMLAMPESKDIWTFEQKKALVGIYGVYLGYARLLNHFELNRHVEDVLPLAEENYWALSGMCEILLKHGTTDRHVELVASLVQKAKQLAQDDKNKLDPSLVSRLEDLLKQKRSNIRSQRGSRKHFGALNA